MKMNNCVIKKLGKKISMKGSRAMLKVKAKSPELMMAAGVGTVIVGTVMACKATLRLEEVLGENRVSIDTVKEHKGMGGYSEGDYKRDLTVTYVQSAVRVTKNYAPAVLTSAIGISLIVGSHKIMKKRNVALMASYKAVDEAFTNYRKRVSDKYGEEVEKSIRYDLKKKKIKDEEGKTIEAYEQEPNVGGSQYARWFDEFSKNWTHSPENNKLFIQAQEKFANQLLHARGHIFLNEVYDMLGMKPTSAGQLVGWVLDNGDNYVDFGIFSTDSDNRAFVNGIDGGVLLDFNVDGPIYDLI